LLYLIVLLKLKVKVLTIISSTSRPTIQIITRLILFIITKIIISIKNDELSNKNLIFINKIININIIIL